MQPTFVKRIIEELGGCGEVTTDSRKVKELTNKGKRVIFFALKGDKFDANNFIEDVLNDGAVVVVSSNRKFATHPNVEIVDDTLVALQEGARGWRESLSATFIAITGSNGKTTTKELLSAVLSTTYNTQSTCGNLNNHIGVPLTLFSIKKECQMAIIEMGANHQKEIELLCSIAKPNFGLITNIGKAHLEGFGSQEGIRKGKGELFDSLVERGGSAFYLKSSQPLSEMILERPTLKNIPYDSSQLEVVKSTMAGIECRYKNLTINSSLVGDYNLLNICAALSVASYFSVDIHKAIEAVERYVPSNMRSQLIEKGANKIVIDAYNANPSSMKSSIETFLRSSLSAKKLFVLADMKELGTYALEEHRAVAQMVASSGFDAILIGSEFSKVGDISGVKFFETTSQAADFLSTQKFEGYDILLKGSRSMGVEALLNIF